VWDGVAITQAGMVAIQISGRILSRIPNQSISISLNGHPVGHKPDKEADAEPIFTGTTRALPVRGDDLQSHQ